MEYVYLTILFGVVALILSYVRVPKFRKAVNKRAASLRQALVKAAVGVRKALISWGWMQTFKLAENRKKKAIARHEAFIKAQDAIIAARFNKATGKQWKGANQPKQDKTQKQGKPEEEARKRAMAAFLLHTVDMQEMSCWPELLSLLAAEAETRAKAKGYSVEVLRNKTAFVYDRQDTLLAQVDIKSGVVSRADQPKQLPVRTNKPVVVQASRPSRQLSQDEINAEIAAATANDYDFYTN